MGTPAEVGRDGGAQAGIEPAVTAHDNFTLGSARGGQMATTQLHPRMRSPFGRARRPSRNESRDGRG